MAMSGSYVISASRECVYVWSYKSTKGSGSKKRDEKVRMILVHDICAAMLPINIMGFDISYSVHRN